jgi:hypothetical protein
MGRSELNLFFHTAGTSNGFQQIRQTSFTLRYSFVCLACPTTYFVTVGLCGGCNGVRGPGRIHLGVAPWSPSSCYGCCLQCSWLNILETLDLLSFDELLVGQLRVSPRMVSIVEGSVVILRCIFYRLKLKASKPQLPYSRILRSQVSV